jgi:hypothetical protein
MYIAVGLRCNSGTETIVLLLKSWSMHVLVTDHLREEEKEIRIKMIL